MRTINSQTHREAKTYPAEYLVFHQGMMQLVTICSNKWTYKYKKWKHLSLRLPQLDTGIAVLHLLLYSVSILHTLRPPARYRCTPAQIQRLSLSSPRFTPQKSRRYSLLSQPRIYIITPQSKYYYTPLHLPYSIA